jgi:cation diffusion facilitator CzcD-associated flavoprotein CzcO
LPQRNREISPIEHRLFARAPFVQRLVRSTIRLLREALAGPLVYWPWLLPALQMAASTHLRRQVPDRDLRAKLTPDFRIGCKRLLVSSTYYPALTRPNVHVVPSLAGFDGTTAIASDGTRHDVDAVVLATGFHTTDLPVADRITGAHGRTLADVWQGSPCAHRGTTVSGFPNLFLVNGPNTGVGHTSVLLHVETQIAYVVNALTTLRAKGHTVFESKQHVQDRWNDEVQRRLQRTVWQRGGCTSDSYMDPTGRNTTLWPGTTGSFGRALRRFDIVEHDTA